MKFLLLLRLTAKLVLANRLWLSLIFCLFFTLILIACLFPLTLLSTEENIRHKSESTYGSHHAAYFALSNVAVYKLENYSRVRELAKINTFGLWRSQSGAEFVVGEFCDSTLLLGNLALMQGRLPSGGSNEAAIERNVAQQLFMQDDAIGNTILLTSPTGKEHSFTIVGILENYSTKWQVAHNQERGRNSFPEIVIISESVPAELLSQNRLVQFDNYDENEVISFGTSLGLEHYYVLANWRAFGERAGEILLIRIMLVAASIGLFLCGLISIFSALRRFKQESATSVQVLHGVGWSYSEIRTTHRLQLQTISFIAALLGGICATIVILVVFPLHNHFIAIGATVAFFVWSSQAIAIELMFAPKKHFSFIRLLRRGHLDRRIKSGQTLKKILSAHFHDRELKMMAISTFGYAMVLVSLTVALVQAHQYLLERDNQKMADITLFSWQSTSSLNIAEYEVVQNRQRVFSYEDVRLLSSIDGIDEVRARPLMFDSRFLLNVEDADEYWMGFYWTDEDDDNEISLEAVVPEELIAIAGVEFETLSDRELSALAKQHSTSFSRSVFDGESAILFAPGAPDSSIDMDIIQVGRLETTEKDILLSNISDNSLIFIKGDILLEKSITDYSFLEIEKFGLFFEAPTVITGQKVAYNEEFFGGYARIDIYFSPDICVAQLKYIERVVAEISIEHPGHLIISLDERIENQRALAISAVVSTCLTAFLATVLFVTSLIFATKSSLMVNAREIKILKSIGASTTDIKVWYQLFAGEQTLMLAVLTSVMVLVAQNYGLMSYFGVVAVIFLICLISLLATYFIKGQLRAYFEGGKDNF